MNKKEMVDLIAQESQLTKKDSALALDAFVTVVQEAMKAGDKVMLSGLGSFSVVDRQERNGINPKTLQPITIPATKAVKFKAGKELKECAKV